MTTNTTSSLNIPYREYRDLVLRIVQGEWRPVLQEGDAQQLANILDNMLHDEGSVEAEVKKSTLSLVNALAEECHVIPQYHMPTRVEFGDMPFWGGGTSDVYRGNYHGATVCVKVVRSFKEKSNMQMLRGHMRDFITWAHLSHPNILPFYGVFLHGEAQRVCLVSPLMANGNLRAYLQNKAGTPPLLLVSDILAGLQHLHSQSIVHGDLKTNNVLISDEGRALIADFGIAYFVKASGLNVTQSTTSTVRYTAPELFEGDEDVPPTRKSDMWSFGCVCCEIYTLKGPFSGCKHNHRVIIAVSRGNIPYRTSDKIPKNVWEMANECWTREPSDRPTCDEIRSKYFSAEDDRPIANPQMAADREDFWKKVKTESGVRIDYEHACRILSRVR